MQNLAEAGFASTGSLIIWDREIFDTALVL